MFSIFVPKTSIYLCGENYRRYGNAFHRGACTVQYGGRDPSFDMLARWYDGFIRMDKRCNFIVFQGLIIRWRNRAFPTHGNPGLPYVILLLHCFAP